MLYLKSRLTTALFITIGLFLVLLASGCDPYQTITFYNQTLIPIQVDITSVPLDYAGTPQFSYPPGDTIKAGESKKYVAPVSKGRSVGAGRKYIVAAVDERGEVMFSRVFTWDELNELGWKVVITEQK